MSEARDENLDPLTGLYSKKYMSAMVDEWDVMKAYLRPDERHFLGIVLADVFNLKPAHDCYGHGPIDNLIRDVGQVFLRNALSQEIPCRYGTDAFLLVVPQTDLAEMQERAEKIRLAANQIRIVSYEGETRETIRLSVGVAVWPPRDWPLSRNSALWGIEALMQAADVSLQECRRGYLADDESSSSKSDFIGPPLT